MSKMSCGSIYDEHRSVEYTVHNIDKVGFKYLPLPERVYLGSPRPDEHGAHCYINPDGDITYWVDGKLHRNTYPAVTLYSGDGTVNIELWYHHGKLSRTNGGPAATYHDTRMWFIDNVLHRDTGPALVARQTRHMELYTGERNNYFKDLEYVPLEYDNIWYNHGLISRKGERAILNTVNETGVYYTNNILTRLDGPCIITADLHIWIVDGLFHRDGLPAVTVRGPSKILTLNIPNTETIKVPYQNIWYINGVVQQICDCPSRHYMSEECVILGSTRVHFQDGRLTNYTADGLVYHTT